MLSAATLATPALAAACFACSAVVASAPRTSLAAAPLLHSGRAGRCLRPFPLAPSASLTAPLTLLRDCDAQPARASRTVVSRCSTGIDSLCIVDAASSVADLASTVAVVPTADAQSPLGSPVWCALARSASLPCSHAMLASAQDCPAVLHTGSLRSQRPLQPRQDRNERELAGPVCLCRQQPHR